jgi:hypothetical protein
MDNPYYGWGKFRDVDKDYFAYIETLLKSDVEPKDLIYHFPVFVGHVNLARYLFFTNFIKRLSN